MGIFKGRKRLKHKMRYKTLGFRRYVNGKRLSDATVWMMLWTSVIFMLLCFLYNIFDIARILILLCS